ncbi:MAG: hypothetical protein ACREIV_02520, partial [Planctomycetaceae bacterium]
VLKEISDVRIAEQERLVLTEKYQHQLGRHVTLTAFQLGAELTSAQYLSAVRTGARSWWDYRGLNVGHEFDTFKVDRERMAAVMARSSQFLETFWTLTRKRDIPDRWLIRDHDLERLEQALAEPDPAVRLRVLMRMSEFMECFPPWWYYVARTQQELGQLFAAVQTYEHLLELGAGHFRIDEMLASAAANQAILQEYLGQPSAPDTAAQALTFATNVWPVNLAAALVLERHGRLDAAEEALLRNLDVGLERRQSLHALVALYCNAGRRERLAKRLSEPAAARLLPASLLLRAAATFGPEGVPPAVAAQLTASLSASVDRRFGGDEIVVRIASGWHPPSGRPITLLLGDRALTAPAVQPADAVTTLRFRGAGDLRGPLPPMTLAWQYADGRTLRLHLRAVEDQRVSSGSEALAAALPFLSPRGEELRLYAVDVGETRLTLGP